MTLSYPGIAMDTTQTYGRNDNMLSHLRPALVALGLFTLLTGLAQVLFPGRANGSLMVRNGQPVGSELIGQPVDDAKYFWGRLSATNPAPYTPTSASPLLPIR